MPARDGTGPLSQGSHIGRGMGNCASTNVGASQSRIPGANKSLGWGERAWGATFGRLFRRRRANHANRK